MKRVESLELASLKAGAVVDVTAGEEPKAWRYSFTIVEPGNTPRCDFTQTDPDGAVVGPLPVILEGAGRWTTVQENPMLRGDALVGRRHQEKGMSIGEGMLRLNRFVIIFNASNPPVTAHDRLQLMPECTDIQVTEAA